MLDHYTKKSYAVIRNKIVKILLTWKLTWKYIHEILINKNTLKSNICSTVPFVCFVKYLQVHTGWGEKSGKICSKV